MQRPRPLTPQPRTEPKQREAEPGQRVPEPVRLHPQGPKARSRIGVDDSWDELVIDPRPEPHTQQPEQHTPTIHSPGEQEPSHRQNPDVQTVRASDVLPLELSDDYRH